MTLKTTAVVGSVIIMPLLTQAVQITGYSGGHCNFRPMVRCENVEHSQCCPFPLQRAPDHNSVEGPKLAWYPYGSVLFDDYDDSYWTSGPTAGPNTECTGPNVGHFGSAGAGVDRCYERPLVGRRAYLTLDPRNVFATGGGIFYRRDGEPGRRLLRRIVDGNQTAENPKSQQCPADANHCTKVVIPTLYIHDEDDNQDYILDSLSKDQFYAYQEELKTAEKSRMDIVKAFGARRVDESQIPS